MAPKKGGLGRGLGSLFDDINIEPVSIIEGSKEPERAEISRLAADSAAQGTAAENVAMATKDAASRASKAPAKTAIKKAAMKTEELAATVSYIEIGNIKPNSKQPRTVFNQDALNELAESIKKNGVIQPIMVRPAATGYELVSGERRWRASRIAGLKKIPAIIREITDEENSIYALIENMQREDLNALEEARGLARLMREYDFTQEQAANAVGKSRPYVANALRLLKLPEEVCILLDEGKLSAGHARAIAGLKSEELQIEAATKAAKEGWSVRQIEGYTGQKKAVANKKSSVKKRSDAVVTELEAELSQNLGVKVTIKGSEKIGKIELQYFSRGDLDRLIEILRK